MRRDVVAGIDSSTQSCTVMLRHLETGEVLALARSPHPATTPPCSEQDPEAWWSALCAVFTELKPWLPRIAAISVGGQGHGLVLLDEHDKPLRPAKLWNDTESDPQAKKLLQLFSPAEWATLTGSVPGPAMTISKLAWTEENCPGLLDQSHKIMLPFDYLVYRLTGHCVTERGGSSGTGYFNPFTNEWVPKLAEAINPAIDWISCWPQIVPSNSPAGLVSAAAGFPELTGAVVSVGTGDNMSAALGMNLKTGDLGISIGTSGTLYGISADGITDASGTINGYADAADRYLPMITTLNAAKVTDAFRRMLSVSTELFDELALSAPPGANGVTLIPWLDGERTPNLPEATGTLVGIRTTTTNADIARATVEGVLCGLLAGGKFLEKNGVKNTGRIVITGGGAKSAAYRQILADLTNKPVWVSPLTETAAAGAAIQAAAALNNCSNDAMAEKWHIPWVCTAEPEHDARAVLEQYISRMNILSEIVW